MDNNFDNVNNFDELNKNLDESIKAQVEPTPVESAPVEPAPQYVAPPQPMYNEPQQPMYNQPAVPTPPPYYGNPQYGQYQPQYNQPQEKDDSKGFAIASLVLGIVSFLCCGFICSILGFIFGIISKQKKPQDNAMATVGIVLSVIGFVLTIISIIILVATGTYESYLYF